MSHIWMTWLMQARDMTHSFVWHDSLIRVTWRIFACSLMFSFSSARHSWVHECHVIRELTSVTWFMSQFWSVWCDSEVDKRDVTQESTSAMSFVTWQVSCDSDRKNPPPLGGFPIYYVPWSRTRRKRTPPEEPPPKLINLGVVLQGGSSSSGFLIWKPPNKETPPGGGFLSINSWVDKCDVIHDLTDIKWLVHACDMTPACVCHDSYMCVTVT